ncbi:MAG: type II toxin-antitoxin system RelB/DinJ family antitoxin [Clostridiales bacterium]|nr:type II toxin-antitoxin system RelB/DinJ family antitoxin [Clostridiales bacterium]
MATSVIQVRVDDELRQEATEIFEDLGIDMSTAIRMFLKRTVKERGLPFSMIAIDDSTRKHNGKVSR